MSRDNAALLDILKAARKAREFVGGNDQRQFVQDEKTQSSVLHQLMVLGEAVKRLSDEFRAQHSSLPWHEMAGMRDKLVHDYDEVDLEQVWNTVTRDLADLIDALEKLEPQPGSSS